MPLYCFYDVETEMEFEKTLSAAYLDSIKIGGGSYLLDGRVVRIDHSRQHGEFLQDPKEFYIESDAAAIHPMDIAAEKAMIAKHGLKGIDFNPEDGRCIARNKKDYVHYLALKGLNYRQGGYSETVPDSQILKQEIG